tara:strand:+ start:189277 stop:189948 length:672 start_codon:yes stop_codon:yes gene_type:complete
MKKIILLLLVAVSMSTFAQKELKEGVITMKMNMSTDNEQAKAAFAMIGDITTTTHFKGQKARSEYNNQMTGGQISIVDGKAKKMLLLMDNPMLGKKYMEQDIAKTDEELKDITVTANGETKTILDYNCKGYDIVTTQNGQEIKMKMFVTDKIAVQEQYTAMLGGKLKGFPMYMVISMNQGGMAMDINMEVTEVKDKSVADSKFDMTVPEGYAKLEMPKPTNID